MIQTETSTINGVQFTRTYSDSNRYVVRDGVEYEEAIDPTGFGRTYVEGRIIESEDPDETSEILDVLLGGSDD